MNGVGGKRCVTTQITAVEETSLVGIFWKAREGNETASECEK